MFSSHNFLKCVLACWLLPAWAWGQTFHIRGQVLSEEDAGVPFANIVLLSAADSSLVKAVTSNDAGQFDIGLGKPGRYLLQVAYIGYDTYQSDPMEVVASLKLPTIRLQPSSESLEAVTVVGEKPLIEIKPDMTVYNVKQVGGTAGLDGLELLRSSPGVVIDNDNNIVVEGKQGVQVWIDGKPSILAGDDLTQYLRSLRASDIEAIEIITQPSSKYDAAGTAGIINIRLKRDGRYGVNGSIGAGVGYGRYGKWNTSATLNARSKRVNFFGSFSQNDDQTFSFIDARRSISQNYFEMESDEVRLQDAYNFKAGLDFELSPKSTIGVQTNGNWSSSNQENTSTTLIFNNMPSELDNILIAGSNTLSNSQNINVNANYSFQNEKGMRFSTDVDYGHYTSDRVNDQPNEYYDASLSNVLSRTNFQMVTPLEVTLKSAMADWEQKLGKGQLSLGAKVVEVATDNTFDFYEEMGGELAYRDSLSNDFTYTERVTAGYVNYAYNTQKWGFQIGLRAEHTRSLGELVSIVDSEQKRVPRDYLDWFPSGGLTYKLSQDHGFALNFSRRINRPNYQSLNPFEYRVSELQFYAGNPFLRPNYTNSIRLSHTYKYAITTAFSYSYRTDFNAQVTDTLDFETTFLQPRNVANEEVISLSVSSPIPLNKWWNMYINLSGSYQRYIPYDDSFTAVEVPTFNFFGKSTFSLPVKIKFEISGWFNSPSVWGGTYRTKSLGSLNLAVYRKFMQDKLSVNLSANDILYTAPWYGEADFGAVTVNANGGWESRVVRLNLSYAFGNQKIKTNKRKTGVEEEMNRISR